MTTKDDELAALKKEVNELKASIKKPPPDMATMEKEFREYQNQLHQMREAQMSRASAFTAADYRAFEAACSTKDLQDIVRHSAVQSPSSINAPNQKADPAPKVEPNKSGWVEPRPLGPQPGINHVDRLMDEQDRREELERRAKR
jgi:hypothetical protein